SWCSLMPVLAILTSAAERAAVWTKTVAGRAWIPTSVVTFTRRSAMLPHLSSAVDAATKPSGRARTLRRGSRVDDGYGGDARGPGVAASARRASLQASMNRQRELWAVFLYLPTIHPFREGHRFRRRAPRRRKRARRTRSGAAAASAPAARRSRTGGICPWPVPLRPSQAPPAYC